MKKAILWLFLFLFMLFCLKAMQPVPSVNEGKALSKTGIVHAIYEAGEKDVVFELKQEQQKFYINRGLENGLELVDLQNRLIGKEVTFKFPKYWTPLDWNNSIRSVLKIETKDEVIFDKNRKDDLQ